MKNYTNTWLPFNEDFYDDFNVVSPMGTGHLFDMVKNHLPRGLVMEKVLFDAHTQVYKSVDDL